MIEELGIYKDSMLRMLANVCGGKMEFYAWKQVIMMEFEVVVSGVMCTITPRVTIDII